MNNTALDQATSGRTRQDEIARAPCSGIADFGSVSTPRPQPAWGGLNPFEIVRKMYGSEQKRRLKRWQEIREAQQPAPFTPGLTKAQVREHARRLIDQRLLENERLAGEDWVRVERDLIEEFKATSS